LNFRGFGGALESIALIRTDSLRTLDFNEELSTSAGLDLFYRLGNKDNVLLLPDILMGYLKYPGQWHRGFKTLEKDALKMASLMDPVTASKVLEGIRNYEALINLKSLVKNGSKWGSFHNLRRTIRVSFFFFVVAYFSRQIKAFLLALKYRVELRILRTHTHQFLNTTV
jgi:hypothetical protein